MKILAINGSPKGKNSVTYRMLDAITAGMQQAGASTEIINLIEYKIGHCRGCFACWFKTPGKCIIKDDMAGLLEKVADCDLIIFGTPLYVYSMTGLMKDFLDRAIPLIEPFMIERKDKDNVKSTEHPKRGKMPTKVLLVSNCGFPEASHFEALSHTFRMAKGAEDVEYYDEIFCSMGPLLAIDELKALTAPYFAALNQAGEQIIKQGAISADVKTKLQADILPGGASAYRDMVNTIFKKKVEQVEK